MRPPPGRRSAPRRGLRGVGRAGGASSPGASSRRRVGRQRRCAGLPRLARGLQRLRRLEGNGEDGIVERFKRACVNRRGLRAEGGKRSDVSCTRIDPLLGRLPPPSPPRRTRFVTEDGDAVGRRDRQQGGVSGRIDRLLVTAQLHAAQEAVEKAHVLERLCFFIVGGEQRWHLDRRLCVERRGERARGCSRVHPAPCSPACMRI
eukprot:274217-Chlamydomonas_euryale.AAC.9